MKPYIFLPHTADIKFRAYGKSMEKAFENAAYALTDSMVNHKKVKALKTLKISVKSEDEKALLYDFLEQFLILADSKGFLLSNVKKLKIKPFDGKGLSLTAEIVGDTRIEKYDVDTHIKAVTYEEMIVEEDQGEVMVQVILDI